jgi:gamma-glutamyltranspeptidase/glutathione hydrolase
MNAIRLARPIRLIILLSLLAGPAQAAERFLVSTANPHASRAAQEIVTMGGSAVDAAIAAQMVLTLVEPQSSGIGGGAFLLHYDSETGQVTAYDGRETAPAGATPDMFLNSDGEPKGFYEAVVGGLSVGVPGVLRMLELAHRDHGKLPWGRDFGPAVRLATLGFRVSPRLHDLIAADGHLKAFPAAHAYFYDAAGQPLAAGAKLTNPELAATFRTIAAGGARSFYEGPIAEDIARAVRNATVNPGTLSAADIAAYEAKRREALCRDYREWRVCGMPPPTSGGLTDRAVYIGDPDFVPVPVGAMLEPGYLAERAALIRRDRSMGEAPAGLLQDRAEAPPQSQGFEGLSTTHLVVVDQEGDVVSMTSSIENAFGSRLMVRGFLLNNQLTDFAFRPSVGGRPVANAAAPGKRPRSSMSPTIVLDREGAFRYAIGSPGGSRIIAYVVKALVGVLDWGLDVQAAIDLPNHVNRNGRTELERGTALEAIAEPVRDLGHEVVLETLISGGADPRREGMVVGD